MWRNKNRPIGRYRGRRLRRQILEPDPWGRIQELGMEFRASDAAIGDMKRYLKDPKMAGGFDISREKAKEIRAMGSAAIKKAYTLGRKQQLEDSYVHAELLQAIESEPHHLED